MGGEKIIDVPFLFIFYKLIPLAPSKLVPKTDESGMINIINLNVRQAPEHSLTR